MKTFFRLFLCIVLFQGGLALQSCSSSKLTLTGYVQAAETDDYDNPTDIYIFDGKEEYQISKSEAREQLFDLVDRKVSVSGEISKGWGGKSVISIDDYKVLD